MQNGTQSQPALQSCKDKHKYQETVLFSAKKLSHHKLTLFRDSGRSLCYFIVKFATHKNMRLPYCI